MFLTLDDVLNMREEQLRLFVARKIPEATGFIDYKQAIYKGLSRDEENAEILKDISGFANSQGGNILYGIKDPTSLGEADDAVVGVEDGVRIAKSIENIAANSIDPRLSGFRVIPVPLGKDRHVLVAHIPPDGMRPHRVNHNASKTWNFYVRLGESVRMMTTQEIRDSVLSAATSEQRAISYAREVADEVNDELVWTAPVFFVQAVPLVPLDKLWDVTSNEFRPVMLGLRREHEVGTKVRFYTSFGRMPTLRGVRATDKKTDPALMYEVHRNGYVGAIYKCDASLGNEQNEIFDSHSDSFVAFADLCRDAVKVGESERPYFLRARMLNVMNVKLVAGERHNLSVSKPFTKHIIKFPDIRREAGQSFRDAVAPWRQMLVNAFGLDV